MLEMRKIRLELFKRVAGFYGEKFTFILEDHKKIDIDMCANKVFVGHM